MKVGMDEAQSAIRATVANALAEALVLGIDECEQRGYKLTQKQEIALAVMAVMSYDNAIEAVAAVEAVAAILDAHNGKEIPDA